MQQPPWRILILCTGNSARSQMAEALVNHFLGSRFLAQSAGTRPAGRVHPAAIAAMGEIGIDIAGQRSKSVDEFHGEEAQFDLVITVCDAAAEECPVWLGGGRRMHLGFPDPASAPPPEQAACFRAVRDALRGQLLGLLRDWRPAAGAFPPSSESGL